MSKNLMASLSLNDIEVPDKRLHYNSLNGELRIDGDLSMTVYQAGERISAVVCGEDYSPAEGYVAIFVKADHLNLDSMK